MKITRYIAAVIPASLIALSSCVDTGNIGSSLMPEAGNVVIDDQFTLVGRSVESEEIQSRTTLQLLGSIDAGEYGSLSSDFVTQFMPVAQLDTLLTSASEIDSCKLLMMYNAGQFVGDSVVPMGLEVYRLTKELPAPIFSNFDPEGYYDPTPISSVVYAASNLSAPSDSVAKLSYREIYADLPVEIARNLFDVYKTNPASYLSPTEFAKEFPGLYVKNSYGSGRVTKIQATLIQVYYHRVAKTTAGKDTIYQYTGSFYGATPEIITNNNIRFEISDAVRDRIANGQDLIVSPAGFDVEIEFPIKDVIDYYRKHKGTLAVVNTLTMSIPVESLSNTYGINPPKQVLMILKNKRKKFFEDSKLTDNITSFYADFDSSTGSYIFPSMREFFLDALKREAELTPDDYTFVITPVNIEKETSNSSYYYSGTTYVKTITPYIQAPAMARLLLENAKITFTFTNQN